MKKEFFLKGHKACAGCGPAIAMRHILEGVGEQAIVCLATGCMEVVSTQYPETQWNVPVLHSVFENVPATASGVTRAFKQLKKQGIVMGIGGDGSSYDIGFGALSGAMERNEDYIYFAYDNECYFNTGIQRSGATPWKAWTTTTPREVGGKTEQKKNLAFIAAAHGVPYVATASVAFLPDLQKKIERAKQVKGFRLIVVHAPCPLGWRFANEQTIQIAKKAVESGLWNLFEIDKGAFKFSAKPELRPVDDYLKAQGRFKHLSTEDVKAIQEHATQTRKRLEELEASKINLLDLL